MNDDFEKIFDDALRRWPEEVGHYTWEETLSGYYGAKVKLHILNRFVDDQLMKQSNSGTVARYFLTSKGHNVKRHIDTIGYVAQLKGNVEKNIQVGLEDMLTYKILRFLNDRFEDYSITDAMLKSYLIIAQSDYNKIMEELKGKEYIGHKDPDKGGNLTITRDGQIKLNELQREIDLEKNKVSVDREAKTNATVGDILTNTYNIMYTQENDYGTSYLLALDGEMFRRYLDHYNQGKAEFFNRGATLNIDGTNSVTIYDTSKASKGFPADVLEEQLEKTFNEKGWGPSYVESIFKELGKKVTDNYIKGPFGNLKLTGKIVSEKKKSEFINHKRITELKEITNKRFDLKKLIQLCNEINTSNEHENWFAVGALVRAVLDHVPPIFNDTYTKFEMVANNYKSNGDAKSFKESMQHIIRVKDIADSFLHSQIRKQEILPTETQVDCKRDLDKLLGEIVRIFKQD